VHTVKLRVTDIEYEPAARLEDPVDRLHDFAHIGEVVPDQLWDALVACLFIQLLGNSFDGGELVVGRAPRDVVDPGRHGVCSEPVQIFL
jgi:hypothetical protein